MKHFIFIIIVCAFVTTTANADYVVQWSGMGLNGNVLSVQAEFEISGDTLTLTLTNDSPDPAPGSFDTTDLLGSFYFDIYNGTTRPDLTYESATGNVYLDNAEVDEYGDSISNPLSLMYDLFPDPPDTVTNPEYPLDPPEGWLYKEFDAISMPYGFGLGTVGNSNFNAIGYNFNGMDGPASMIYNGSISGTGNLDAVYLVNNSATFVFSGMSGYTYNDIGQVAFGFGTNAELFVPLPATILLGLLGLGVGGLKLRKKME